MATGMLLSGRSSRNCSTQLRSSRRSPLVLVIGNSFYDFFTRCSRWCCCSYPPNGRNLEAPQISLKAITTVIPRYGEQRCEERGTKLDDATMYKYMYIQKGLEIVVMEDKCKKLEARSMHMEDLFEQMTQNTEGKIQNLESIVAYLTSQETKKGEKIADLEAQVLKLETELKETKERLNKELEDTKAKHEFEYSTLKLQLESATVKLREMHDFSLRKAAMEVELVSLKEQLAKEQRDHAEAISDVERNAVQERERLKKEIERRVEETKQQMTRLMEEQLHQKTKRTITENEQLRKEVRYHTRQTDLMSQKNEKLTNENVELQRNLTLAKEMEDDLSFRNHMYQKTTKILVYKYREMEEEMKKLDVKDGEKKKLEEQQTSKDDQGSEQPHTAVTLEEATPAAKTGEEAMRFLYACLEDLELERLIEAKTEYEKVDSSQASDLGFRSPMSPPISSLGERLISLPSSVEGAPKSLDNLTIQERQEMLKKLLRAAASLRTITDSIVTDALDYSKYIQSKNTKTVGKSNIRIDDILGIPLETLGLDGPAQAYHWKKPTTVAVQADMTPHAVRMRSPTLFA